MGYGFIEDFSDEVNFKLGENVKITIPKTGHRLEVEGINYNEINNQIGTIRSCFVMFSKTPEMRRIIYDIWLHDKYFKYGGDIGEMIQLDQKFIEKL